MTFKIGDKIRCLDPSGYGSKIKKGSVATIIRDPHWERTDWLVLKAEGGNERYGLNKEDKRWEKIHPTLREILEG